MVHKDCIKIIEYTTFAMYHNISGSTLANEHRCLRIESLLPESFVDYKN